MPNLAFSNGEMELISLFNFRWVQKFWSLAVMELRQWSFADTLAVKDMAVTSLTFLTSLTSTLVKLQFFNKISDSAGIQTQDLQNRNLTLYSAKLRSPYI